MLTKPVRYENCVSSVPNDIGVYPRITYEIETYIRGQEHTNHESCPYVASGLECEFVECPYKDMPCVYCKLDRFS